MFSPSTETEGVKAQELNQRELFVVIVINKPSLFTAELFKNCRVIKSTEFLGTFDMSLFGDGRNNTITRHLMDTKIIREIYISSPFLLAILYFAVSYTG